MRERTQEGKGEKVKVEMGVRRREGESYEQPFPSLIDPLTFLLYLIENAWRRMRKKEV